MDALRQYSSDILQAIEAKGPEQFAEWASAAGRFIARVTSHIPDKGQVAVRYYGLYADTHRGKVRKASLCPFIIEF